MTAPVTLIEQQERIGAPAPSEVGTLARRGAMWSAGLIASRYLVSVSATAVLARLLTAKDYGLIGMVATFTALFQFFSDFGLSWATVRCKDLRRQQADNLFWINTGGGALLWAICSLCGPMLNRFYGRTELSSVTVVLGATFLFSGAAVQPMAILRRQMRFRQLTVVELYSHLAGALIGITLAMWHFGYWALVGQAVAAQCALAVLLMLRCRYWPGAPRADSGTLPLLKFGGYLAAFGGVTYLARNLDSVLIGRYWGADELGYYSRAYFLMMLPAFLATGSLNAVMVPALSVLHEDTQKLGQAYQTAVGMVGLIAFPFAFGLAVTAREVVDFVYGPKWAPVASIFAWLSIACLFQPLQATLGWLYIAANKTRTMFFVGVAASAIVCAAFVIGNRWGARGVAAAYACANLALILPLLATAHRSAGLRLRSTIRVLVPLFIAAAAMGLVALAMKEAAGHYTHSRVAVLLLTAGAGATFYTGVVLRFCSGQVAPLMRGWSGSRQS